MPATDNADSAAERIVDSAAAKTAGGKRPRRHTLVMWRHEVDEGVGIVTAVTGTHLVHALGKPAVTARVEQEAEFWADDPAEALAVRGLRATVVPLRQLDALEWAGGANATRNPLGADGSTPGVPGGRGFRSPTTCRPGTPGVTRRKAREVFSRRLDSGSAGRTRVPLSHNVSARHSRSHAP